MNSFFCILFLFTLRSISSSCYARELCWCMRIRHIQQLLNKNGERFGLFLFAHSHMRACVCMCVHSRLQCMRTYLFPSHWELNVSPTLHACMRVRMCECVCVRECARVCMSVCDYRLLLLFLCKGAHTNTIHVGTLNALSWQFVAFRCYRALATHIHAVYISAIGCWSKATYSCRYLCYGMLFTDWFWVAWYSKVFAVDHRWCCLFQWIDLQLRDFKI